MWTIFLLIFISTVLGAGAWLLFLWAVRSDQFDDMEGPKHRMLDDEQDADRAKNFRKTGI
jgi:cbb3-type cytochrome oxidase maturation protein